MNQKTMTYVILICMIFISLGIGMYFFNIREGAAASLDNKGTGVNVGDKLRDDAGNLVFGSTGNNFIIKHLTSQGIVDKVDPDIKLDNHGFAIKNANGKFIYNPAMYLLDEDGKIKKDSTGNPIPNPDYKESSDDKNKYNSDNVNLQYHETEAQVSAESDNKDLQDGTVYVNDQNGNLVAIPRSNVQNNVTYYQPDSYRFGASTYVPTYEDSVYLSRTTGMSSVGAYNNPEYMYGGVCANYKNQPAKLEEACQKMDGNTCASTSCCVLLGGKKCVSGNEQGPTVRSNYSDVYVPNRDFYYFQGKCYGNCP